MAKRSYPASEVRDCSREELPRVTGQWWPGRATLRPNPVAAGGATPRLRPVAAGKSYPAPEKSYPASEASGGQEETSNLRDQGRPGEATSRQRAGALTLRSHPEPRPGPSARRSNPKSGGYVAQEGLEELSHVEGQERWR